MCKGILLQFRPLVIFIVVLIVAGAPTPAAAQSGPTSGRAAAPVGPNYSAETLTLNDGSQAVLARINGPATPPPGSELERAPVPPSALNQPGAAKTIPVPAYNWVYGCSAVSASMVGAYFDQHGYPDIYTGPTNGGVMPMNNSVWPTWTDGAGVTYPGNPLVASRNGLDGRTGRGSIDDYWVAYGSAASDPYVTGGWAAHTWGTAIGDFMKTSQSALNNPDGSTYFTWWLNGTRMTCDQMATQGFAGRDGTYGRKMFYEARGYSVTDCYNQRTDNGVAGGFSFANYKTQIDAGQPVLLNLKGHTVVGIGYADPSTIYLNDTWDYATHSMTWGGSYGEPAMLLEAVSVVTLSAPTAPKPTITSLDPSSALAGAAALTLTVNGTDFANNAVVRWNGSNRVTTYVSATRLTATIPAADLAAPGTASVTVFNPPPGGGASNALSFTVSAASTAPTITSLAPASALAGGPAFTLTVNGTNFASNAVVRWNGSNRVTTYVSTTRLTAAIPAADLAAPGTASVTVFNPPPGGGASNGVSFTVRKMRGTYLSLVRTCQVGLQPGYWQSSGGDAEFYVTSDRMYVDRFAIYVDARSIGCGVYKITHLVQVPISGMSFSFSGPFYASGTFVSTTAADVIAGLTNFEIEGCGTVNGGPWPVTRVTWQSDAAASGEPAGGPGSNSVTPATAPPGVELLRGH